MRYVINDDDIEHWYSLLYQINKDLKDYTIEYIIEEIEKEFHQNVTKENFNDFLKSLRKE